MQIDADARTSDPDIFAIGDCAIRRQIPARSRRRRWPERARHPERFFVGHYLTNY
ncbi:hypothetical protein [Paraburkholderia sp.]|uniref:hypothetical protein n=1 Tax=Paraburkholderia sp. TaxID=1926495 RepID=UPI003424973A